MATVTLARLYEDQGHLKDALSIYKEVLKHDPENLEAKVAVKRLSGERTKFEGANKKMVSYFVKMTSQEEFRKFENWLVKWN